MPIKYNQERFGPTEKEFKNRNNTVRKVFNAKGLPRNMGNKEILSRVKVYDNVRTLKGMRNSRYGNDLKMKISNFISNGRVFNQRKRKALVELMLRFDGPHILEILALKNEDVIRYIKYTADFFGDSGVEFRGGRIPHYIANLTYKRRGPHPDYYKRRRGPIREDPGAVRVLKKRTAFLKEMLKVQVGTGTPARDGYGDIGGVMRFRLPRNIRNKISVPSHTNYIHPRHIWRFMQKEFPLPPHPKNAATKIQSVVRGMRNRKKLTTMRKAATTIQKTVRGMSTRKKMKTVAGKRKASTSIKTTSAGKRKRSPQ
jgi:hypothetical protein